MSLRFDPSQTVEILRRRSGVRPRPPGEPTPCQRWSRPSRPRRGRSGGSARSRSSRPMSSRRPRDGDGGAARSHRRRGRPQIRQRDVSPVELVDALLARIERAQPTLKAFVTVDAEGARAAARAAEASHQAGRNGRSAAWACRSPPRTSTTRPACPTTAGYAPLERQRRGLATASASRGSRRPARYWSARQSPPSSPPLIRRPASTRGARIGPRPGPAAARASGVAARLRPAGARDPDRRLDPAAGRLQRRRRTEADLRPGQPPGDRAVVLEPRPRRADCPIRGGCRAGARRHRRPRSARSAVAAGPRTRLSGSPGEALAGAAPRAAARLPGSRRDRGPRPHRRRRRRGCERPARPSPRSGCRRRSICTWQSTASRCKPRRRTSTPPGSPAIGRRTAPDQSVGHAGAGRAGLGLPARPASASPPRRRDDSRSWPTWTPSCCRRPPTCRPAPRPPAMLRFRHRGRCSGCPRSACPAA